MGFTVQRWIGFAVRVVMSTVVDLSMNAAVALSMGAAIGQKFWGNELTYFGHQTILGAAL